MAPQKGVPTNTPQKKSAMYIEVRYDESHTRLKSDMSVELKVPFVEYAHAPLHGDVDDDCNSDFLFVKSFTVKTEAAAGI